MATNNRRGALHTPLDTCRDKLLKFHDEAIKQSLEEREKAYNALHERLGQYEAHIADRIDREWQKKRLDENMARMRSEEARRKREVLERLEDNEKTKNKLQSGPTDKHMPYAYLRAWILTFMLILACNSLVKSNSCLLISLF